ncbi:MAG: molybdate ABC transporter substrate-binding protein [Spirochaetaceae bacterium]|jgi:molybdate transport system substrate-binding protein|nr:molybdate ABC transporter substrate-binding protein [Spirochaetaceae bacterium]
MVKIRYVTQKMTVLVLAAALVVPLLGQKKAEKTVILTAAAASLKNVYEKELIPRFQKKYPAITVTGSYDSSGKLQTQIENGLAADVFMSAAVKQMDALVKGGYVARKDVVNLLQNGLVLIKSAKGKTQVADFRSIGKAAAIAIGDPKSVPAGDYAQQALTTLGVWQTIPQEKLSYGTNVTEVLNWVAQGSAEVGIVYSTDAASKPKEITVITVLENGVLREPVIYPLAPLAKSAHPAEAREFIQFLQSKEALDIFQKYGFSPAQ